jgi:hypothetical protein
LAHTDCVCVITQLGNGELFTIHVLYVFSPHV